MMPLPVTIDADGNVVRLVNVTASHRPNSFRDSCLSRSLKRVSSVSCLFWSILLVFLAACCFEFFIDTYLSFFTIILAGWFISLALHEFGHAVVAYYGGDTSVADAGYLTLDVLKYTDFIMTFVMPMVFLLWGGIPLPGGAVNIMRHNLANKKWETYVSLAGPLTNFTLGILVAIPANILMRLPSVSYTPLLFPLSALAYIQFFAAVLNMLPLPPLDGWNAVEPWLPDSFFLKKWANHRRYGRLTEIVCIFCVFIFIRYGPLLNYAVNIFTKMGNLSPEVIARAMSRLSNPSTAVF